MHRRIREACRLHPTRVALVEGPKQTTYHELWSRSGVVARSLKSMKLKRGEVVAVFGEKTAEFAAVQLGVWRAGLACVTLMPQLPAKELEHYVVDSRAKMVVANTLALNNHRTVSPKVLLEKEPRADDPDVHAGTEDMACLFYTSGTSALPKGVVTTHGALQAMTKGMVQAWEWTANDRILHFLPLHHVHGAINKLLTPLSVGAQVEFVHFEPESMLKRLVDANTAPTIFMGVPTIYAKMIEYAHAANIEHLPEMKTLVRAFVCGSAALPVPQFESFRALSGHRILERWGMSEVGMGLSNPYRPEEKRIPGYVGKEMPGIQVKIVDLDSAVAGKGDLQALPPDTPGDLIVRGASVFKMYWGAAAPKTATEFTPDGWFITGDVAVYDSQVDSYKILGRKSVDVIKSGGYKISALEIERDLLSSTYFSEAVVLGIPDDTWGEVVAAMVVLKKNHRQPEIKIDEQFIKILAGKTLATYKVPRKVLIVEDIPKNAMGKVNKKALRSLF